MHRNSRIPAVGMAKLLVRSPLPSLDETVQLEAGDNLARFENRDAAHSAKSPRAVLQREIETPLTDANRFRTDKLGVEGRLAILEQHRNDFREILPQLLGSFSLRMRAGKAGDVANVESRGVIALENGFECAHSILLVSCKEIYPRRRAHYTGAMI